MDNISIFETMNPIFKINKPIRLIECFAGVGSQAMALRNLGADFEHYRVVEFDKYAVASYNAIHGTSFKTKDITQTIGEDLNIIDTDKYTYIMTYSFPCQDLSVAGKMGGMTKNSGTRSGLLWEVERLLNEVKELPQVLLMENVPQVIGKKNIADFNLWQDFLESTGYSNYVDTLNAKNYGVAQNRNRTFMVSILGKWNYNFPKQIPLTKTMKDYLEDEVDEKYYIKTEKAQNLIQQLIESGQLKKAEQNNINVVGSLNPNKECQDRVRVLGIDGICQSIRATDYKDPAKICADGSINNPKIKDVSNCIKARYDAGISNLKSDGGMVVECKVIGQMDNTIDHTFESANRVYDKEGISPTINTCGGGGLQPKVIVASRGRNKENPSDRTPGNYVEQRLEPNSEGLCNTLTSVQKDNLVLEPNKTYLENAIEQIIEKNNGEIPEAWDLYNKNPINNGISKALSTDCGHTGTAGATAITHNYRIRKLTPLECWRLMAFTDEDFHKAEQVNSNTQLYKQAGNSICVNVLEAIFKQMM